MSEIIVTEQTFDREVLQSDLPVLVDCWASWCGPCRMLSPVIAQIAEEQAGKAKVCKINVDEQPALAARYGIASIPTVMVFRNGKVANTAVGFRPKAQLEALLQ